MPKDTGLAQFLRARRAQLRPTDVGLPKADDGRRRVDGLRREEVAFLAGISVDYYLRIEQGRETSPSNQVLEGIAKALQLDDDGAAYIHDLVRQPWPARRHAAKEMDPALQWLVNGWSLSPVQIHDGGLNIVSTNTIARAVCPRIRPGTNMLRVLFLDDYFQSFYRNWNEITVWAVGWVRAQTGHNPNPQLAGVIEELEAESQRFRALWSQHSISHDSSGIVQISHPHVGPFTLKYQHLTLQETDHVLIVYWAQPGSKSERAVRRLGAISPEN